MHATVCLRSFAPARAAKRAQWSYVCARSRTCPGLCCLQIPFSREWKDILSVAKDYDLAVSGDALAHMERIGLAQQVIPLVQVGDTHV